jgi:hypothetical protein
LPNGCFKKAMAQAAIDIPGATKAQIGRLVSIADPTVYLYGTPMLYMAPVRQAGMNHTPDIRTRAIFPQAACLITVRYIKRLIRSEGDLMNLLAAAGMICGIGDGRTEKGSFDFGQFEVVEPNDQRWLDIVKQQGRAAQEEALAHPVAYDEDTEELLSYYHTEVIRRSDSRSKPVSEAIADGESAPRRKRGRQPNAVVAVGKRGNGAKRVHVS